MNQTPKGEARTELPNERSPEFLAWWHEQGRDLVPWSPEDADAAEIGFEAGRRAALAQSRTPEPAPDIDQAWKEGFCRGHEMASTVRDVTEALNAARKKFGLDHPAGAVAEAAQPEPAPMSKIEAAGRQAMRAMNERHRAEGREAPQT